MYLPLAVCLRSYLASSAAFVFIDFKFASHDLLLCFELRFHVAGTF
jgi:hypothetical protein